MSWFCVLISASSVEPHSAFCVSSEPLEPRCLLAGVHLIQHVLYVAGRLNVFNTIYAAEQPGRTAIIVDLSYVTTKGTAVNIDRTFPASDHIKLLAITGGESGNHITIDQTNDTFTIPVNVEGGDGQDTIITGDERDTIRAGAGDDWIETGGGNDRVYAGSGTDTIYAGWGNDTLIGGSGDGPIYAGSGTDRLAAYQGRDTMVSGTGPDTFLLSNKKLTPIVGFNPAKDKYHHVNPPSTSSSNFFTQLLDAWFPFFT